MAISSVRPRLASTKTQTEKLNQDIAALLIKNGTLKNRIAQLEDRHSTTTLVATGVITALTVGTLAYLGHTGALTSAYTHSADLAGKAYEYMKSFFVTPQTP